MDGMSNNTASLGKALLTKGSDRIAKAEKFLKAAIERHERHMSGKEPTSEKSQMKMMDEMKQAMAALQGRQ